MRAIRIIVALCIIIGIQIWNVYLSLQTQNIERLTLLHYVGKTVILYQKGVEAMVITDKEHNLERLLKDYMTAERIESASYEPLRNVYNANGKKLFILNKTELDYQAMENPDLLVLSGSPKINLDRYLKTHQPQMIFADGSNYKSFIKRWRNSCEVHKIPFYDTAKEGALVLDLK